MKLGAYRLAMKALRLKTPLPTVLGLFSTVLTILLFPGLSVVGFVTPLFPIAP